MKIAIISTWFSEKMGYSENFLPKALAQLGHEVHLVSSNTQIYYSSPDYKEIYEPFLGPNIVDCGIKKIDGFILHRLPYYKTKSALPGILGLRKYLEDLKPDIIQTYEVDDINTYESAMAAKKIGCKFFTESHMHASVFKNDNKNFKQRIKSFLKNFNFQLKIINSITSKCFPISQDAASIANFFQKVPLNKIKVQSLGVDTNLFRPLANDEDCKDRNILRKKLGFKESDVVCIYTGRFTKDKNPRCLALAIDYLNKNGHFFGGLFVGSGNEEENKFISSMEGCVVHPFVLVNSLPSFYRAAEIGVWPRQESISQLDAVACGLPIVVSNKVQVTERVEGNGLFYEENNYLDLANKLIVLKNFDLRKKMGDCGIKKILDNYSWLAIAKERIKYYQESL